MGRTRKGFELKETRQTDEGTEEEQGEVSGEKGMDRRRVVKGRDGRARDKRSVRWKVCRRNVGGREGKGKRMCE